MTASTGLEGTLQRLDRIIEEACAERSYLGVFPAMYRIVTATIRQAIQAGGFFDDDARVEHLTVVFADLYFDAYDRYRAGEDAAVCWSIAFATAETPRGRMLLQHLLLGMNAHINLDLGVATVSAAGRDLPAVHRDFLLVNEILFQVLDHLQDGLSVVSPRMELLDRLGGSWDERVMRVGIRTCRDMAWSFAANLIDADDPDTVTRVRDEDAAWLARSMLRPWSPVGLTARMVSRSESRDIPAVVDALGRIQVDLELAGSSADAAIDDAPAVPASLRTASRSRRR